MYIILSLHEASISYISCSGRVLYNGHSDTIHTLFYGNYILAPEVKD